MKKMEVGKILNTVFPPEIEVTLSSHAEDCGRFIVYNPKTNMTVVLGKNELNVAQLFNGHRTYDKIQHCLKSSYNIQISVDKLVTFEQRLLNLGILENSSFHKPWDEDPFTGMKYGFFHFLVVIRLFAFNPDKDLDRLIQRLPWLVSQTFVFFCLLIVAIAASLLSWEWSAFKQAVPQIVTGWGWLWLFLIFGLSIVFHEGGHALACKAFGVRVHEVGIAFYFFMLKAWTHPIQKEWNNLSKEQRIVTILIGPLGSLVFGAIGIIVWWISSSETLVYRIAVLMALAAPLGVIPTLLPIFNGDGYLLLSECFNLPGLRKKSFEYLRYLLSGKGSCLPPISWRQKYLYLVVSVGTLVSWVMLWFFLSYMLLFIIAQEIGIT